jgi:hypothetical protein
MLMHTLKNLVVALALLALMGQSARAADIDKTALMRAHNFLKSEKRGKFIGGFCHLGLTYRSHTYAETRGVKNALGTVPGHFALIYDLKMSDGVETRLAFLCDARGNVYEAQSLKSTGIIQAPYVLANGSIKLVGKGLYEVMKKNMKEGERKSFQGLVDRADARALMVFCLRVQQATE